MTFFLMRNKFQQQNNNEEDENGEKQAQQKKGLIAAGGSLLSGMFGTNKPTSPQQTRRKCSRNDSNASSPSRASSGGRSTTFPPRRISFDEPDYGIGDPDSGRGQEGGGRTHSATPRGRAPVSNDNRPDDHSSGTTDPPDEDPNEALDAWDDQRSTKSDHGSDTSGPDSPVENVQLDDELVIFMRQFVEQIFQNTKTIDQNEKNTFGEYVRSENGRLWFARFINSQRINYSSKVDEGTFYRLVQYIAIVMFECYQEEDYAPAKILMNICFTFYKEVAGGKSRTVRREFLYHHLRKQAIWHSLKFWNAAYFDAMQADRAKRAQREQWDSVQAGGSQRQGSVIAKEEDFVYRTLRDFLNNMRAFQVSKESVSEFLRKQSQTVTSEQFRALRDQVESMYR